ncbi:MAG: cob(I)yrinic acid a,c-diamide adenosyltransferase [Flavobacteriaceae bacterium]|nr:cob(I)yrinic acid a,c-diamide adenosyltransferase [Flavobacteriaceae bacterium]
MKIYTKTGDSGKTSLFGGQRVSKSNLRIASYGTVDELNSYIGMIRDQQQHADTNKILIAIQHHLFTLGAELATPPEKEKLKNGKDRLQILRIGEEHLRILEQEIDQMDANLPQMTHFVLPGGHIAVSFCHIARTVCRRAERKCTELYEIEAFNPHILQYLNRLSDYLFVLARKLSQDLQATEIKWIPEKY